MPNTAEISGEISNFCNTKTGLVLYTCPNIQALLSAVVASESLPAALRDAAEQYLDASKVPYPVVRDSWVQLTPEYGLPFHQILEGSSFVLESPKPREKSKELKDRLAKLQELAELKAYNELVKDITKHDHDGDREYFSSYKDSLGFGVHVVLIMFTGYMFGYAMFRSQFQDSPPMHAAGGVLGLIAGMLLETILFIVRASIAEKNSKQQAKTKLKPKLEEETICSDMADPPVLAEEPSSGVRKRHGYKGVSG